jgi:peptidoglycan/LPS O-acetylase OafA/YrhL
VYASYSNQEGWRGPPARDPRHAASRYIVDPEVRGGLGELGGGVTAFLEHRKPECRQARSTRPGCQSTTASRRAPGLRPLGSPTGIDLPGRSESMNERIEALDWLRGLMAISIMVYHLTGWLFLTLDSSGLLGRFGIYGVSVFFVLSGLSMAIVYSNYIKDIRTSLFFYIRRAFRIWPLLWVCIALAVIPTMIKGEPISLLIIIANLTTTFGFIKPEAYILAGAWSIGNEMVYYALTPLIILFFNKKVIYGNLITLCSLLVALTFSFILLNDNKILATQWKLYIHPFNNLFLYLAGIAIYYNLKNVPIRPRINASIFLISLLFFLFYPTIGDQIVIVTGFNRVLFLLFSILLVISFYKFDLYHFVPKIVGIPLEKFGIATYGVYLLHPLVLLYVGAIFRKLSMDNNYIIFASVCVTTIAMALLSYNAYEKKLMAIGKKITKSEGGLLRFLKNRQRPISSLS